MINTELHKWLRNRKKYTAECPSLNGAYSPHPLYTGSGIIVEEVAERLKEGEADDYKERVTSGHTRGPAFMTSEQLWKHAQNRGKSDPEPTPTWRG